MLYDLLGMRISQGFHEEFLEFSWVLKRLCYYQSTVYGAVREVSFANPKPLKYQACFAKCRTSVCPAIGLCGKMHT